MKSQRLKFVILIAVVAAITFGWIGIGTGDEEVPYVSISELREKEGTWKQRRFRLGGLVEIGSIAYSPDRLSVEFIMSQGEEQLEDVYFDLGPHENLKRCRVRRNEESLDFLRNIKRCRVIREDDDFFEIEHEPVY